MKKRFGLRTLLALVLALCLAVGVANMSLAEGTASVPAADNSPAIYVTQKTANSVVGIQVSEETWDNASGRTTTPVAYGSGVCIAEGGYIATNNHVVADGSSYQVLMPSGEYVDAELVGTDSSTDLAVVKVTDADAASKLVPVEFGSTSDLLVGSTAIAIGNPKGDKLANTVTAGIVSALDRDVSASNTTRKINYIQHDAAINSGNSGGGLFNYKGQLIGINTLRMGNSGNTELSTEGLAFAIPVETVQDITSDLIAHGKVIRPQLGVTVLENTEGPDEPMKGYAPIGAMIYSVVEGGPAERAGLKQYDFIYSVDGVRVTSFAELTTELDKHEAGDTVEIQVCRYAQVNVADNNMMNNFYGFYGNNNSSSSNRYSIYVSGGYEMVTKSVTLEILDD